MRTKRTRNKNCPRRQDAPLPPFDGLTFTDAAAVAAVAGSLHLVASTLSREKPSDALVIDSRLPGKERRYFATSSRCRQFLAHESIFPPRLHGALITPIDTIESKSAGAGRDPFVIKIAPRQRVSFRTLQRRRQTDGRTDGFRVLREIWGEAREGGWEGQGAWIRASCAQPSTHGWYLSES